MEKIIHIHNYSESIVLPTCVLDGYTIYTCRCGDTYKGKYVTATSHTYGNWKVVKEATETETVATASDFAVDIEIKGDKHHIESKDFLEELINYSRVIKDEKSGAMLVTLSEDAV